MLVIPSDLLAIHELAGIEDWILVRHLKSPQTMFAEMKAHSALQTERFVRKSVSRRKFLTWIQENPRRFTTEREISGCTASALP